MTAGRRTGSPRILHLSHTSEASGAELALARVLATQPPWRPLLLTPPTATGDAFASLDGVVPRRIGGVPQPAGVSTGAPRAVLTAAAALVVQAASTRLDPAFRTADLVHANAARAAAYGALAAWTSRVPFVVHLRDTVDTETLGRAGYAWMTRLSLPRADGVIANSRTTLATALPFLRADALTAVIPSAAGLRPRSESPQSRRPGPLRFGMLARIDPWKGQELLIDAFAAAFPDGDEVLELAGGAPFGHEDHVEALHRRAAERGIADRVALLGHVDDVEALLAGWDVAVQYSTRPEPLGQNVLQYLAAGLATMVADEGGPTEWVIDDVNGLRVAPRDAAALAAALRRVASDEALRRRLGAAAAATDGLLDDAAVAGEHARFYAAIVNGRNLATTA